MKVLQVHCTYQYQGGEDSVVASERNLLRQWGITVDELLFNNNGRVFTKVLQAPFNLDAYRQTRKKIAAFRPDVIHIHNLHFAASPSVIYAIQKSRIPFVQTLHNFRLLCPSGVLYFKGRLFLASLRQPFPWTAVRAGVYRNSRLLTGWMALATKVHHWLGTWQKASRYIVLTQHAREILLSANLKMKQHQLAVKPNFSPPAQRLVVPGRHFVFIGRLSEEKGIRVLLEAFAGLRYTIRIAGDGPLQALVADYASRYANIEYAGVLKRELVMPFLAGAQALVFPSVWYEGMPMVIIESFACGVPVIASGLGAMKEMIADGYNGYHFKPGNVADLQRAVATYSALPVESRSRFRQHAYDTYVDQYTPEKNVHQLLQIYETAVQASGVRAMPRA